MHFHLFLSYLLLFLSVWDVNMLLCAACIIFQTALLLRITISLSLLEIPGIDALSLLHKISVAGL